MPHIQWFDNASVADAIALAAELRKPLLVDFWSPTCTGCAKLFATTYQSAAVQSFLTSAVVPIKYDTTRPNEWFLKLNGSIAHFWHPNIAVLDERLKEARRFVGYLPANEFIPQVQVGTALVDLYHRRPESAELTLNALLRDFPTAGVAAEALYWAGVAAYRLRGWGALQSTWARLAREYPTSDWVQRADCLDVKIPEAGFSLDDLGTITLE